LKNVQTTQNCDIFILDPSLCISAPVLRGAA
jgi:hypothetical protein